MNCLEDEKFKKYIENKICKGCSNYCLLLKPNCNKSKIFIKDEYEKYLQNKG